MVKVQGPNGELMDSTQQVPMSVRFMRNGRPVNVDPTNPPRIEAQGDPQGITVIDVAFSGNAMTWKFRSADTAARAEFKLLADPTMGDGVTELSELYDVENTDALADNVESTIGTFETKS